MVYIFRVELCKIFLEKNDIYVQQCEVINNNFNAATRLIQQPVLNECRPKRYR